MKVAVIGSGISGLGSAYVLAKQGVKEIVLYEKEESLGGHAKTVRFGDVDLDLGFMLFNRAQYPNMVELFENLGVDMEVSDMSFSMSLDNDKGCEWGSRNGVSGLLAQENNTMSPYFSQVIKEIVSFKEDVTNYINELEANPDISRSETLGEFLTARGYSELFQKAYLVPICGSIWSCPSDGFLSFSAYSVLSYFSNHHLLQIFGGPQWLTVAGRSQTYVAKARAELERLGCKIRTSSDIKSVLTSHGGGVTVTSGDGSQEVFDRCIMATHAPDTLRMLGDQVTSDETSVLGAFQYVNSDIYLHQDTDLMPQDQASWSGCNFVGSTEKTISVTYWLNILQNIGEEHGPFLVTVNPDHTPKKVLLKWTTGHFFPSAAAFKASQELHKIQGKRNIWFCGAYQGYGFHEDGLKAGMATARDLLTKEVAIRLFDDKFIWESYCATAFKTLSLGNDQAKCFDEAKDAVKPNRMIQISN